MDITNKLFATSDSYWISYVYFDRRFVYQLCIDGNIPCLLLKPEWGSRVPQIFCLSHEVLLELLLTSKHEKWRRFAKARIID